MRHHRRFDSEALYVALDKHRRELRISGRELLRQAGIHTPSTLTRLGRGDSLSADTLAALLVWLGKTDVAPYIITRKRRRP